MAFWDYVLARFEIVFLTALICVILYGLLTVASIMDKKNE